MAQVEAEGVISVETADVSDVVTRAVTHVQAIAASSEAAAEAPVVFADDPMLPAEAVAVDAPGIIGTVKTDDTAEPVSKVTVVSGCFPPSSTDDTHQRVMRGGTLKEPLLLTGREPRPPFTRQRLFCEVVA